VRWGPPASFPKEGSDFLEDNWPFVWIGCKVIVSSAKIDWTLLSASKEAHGSASLIGFIGCLFSNISSFVCEEDELGDTGDHGSLIAGVSVSAVMPLSDGYNEAVN